MLSLSQDHATLARIIRVHLRVLRHLQDGADPTSAHLRELAREYSARVAVDRAAFLEACGIDLAPRAAPHLPLARGATVTNHTTFNRPSTRAPHGSPNYTEKLAAYVTSTQKRKFMRRGGSGWLRRLIDRADAFDQIAEALARMVEMHDSRIRSDYEGTRYLAEKLAEIDFARKALSKATEKR